ncbi:MAG: riboflavin biosynthesis protein RibF, partial [Actinomycetota bacterium]
MQVIQDALRSTDLPRPSVVTIGNYDGIHLGQRATLEQLVARSRALGVAAVVVTFDPHPLRVLAPKSAPPAILTQRQKERLLAELGMDVLASFTFNAELAAMSAETFVRGVLVGRLGVRELLVGRFEIARPGLER